MSTDQTPRETFSTWEKSELIDKIMELAGAFELVDGRLQERCANVDRLQRDLAAERTARLAAEARLVEAVKDTERLDWIEAHPHCKRSMREAIDAAMKP